jgi:rRNA maturation RNase YbeY
MEHKLFFEYIDVEIPDFDPEFFRLWVNDVVLFEGKELGVVTWVFCSDDYLLQMNRKHLNHDYYTDIITFNYNEGNSLSGDLFISWDRVQDYAKVHNEDVFDELCRVMIHGVLHLMGYNDKTPAEQTLMTKKENEMLKRRERFT